MKASTVLSKARKLIRENDLCKGTFARNKYRHEVLPTSQSAVKFCSVGAVYNVLNISQEHDLSDDQRFQTRRVFKFLKETIPSEEYLTLPTRYNDLHYVSKEDIDKWFGRAIKLAKKAEK